MSLVLTAAVADRNGFVTAGTTSEPGYRPCRKNATIRAGLGFTGIPLR
jgi:hypothetical protein